jgi:hypothetical protein
VCDWVWGLFGSDGTRSVGFIISGIADAPALPFSGHNIMQRLALPGSPRAWLTSLSRRDFRTSPHTDTDVP